MKVSNIQYAKSLVEMSVGKNEAELKEVLVNFVALLDRQGDIGRIEAIMSEFEKVWNGEIGVIDAKVQSANKLDQETLAQLIDYIKEQTGVLEVNLKEELKPEVLAGFILHFRDQVIDASAASQIGKLNKELQK